MTKQINKYVNEMSDCQNNDDSDLDSPPSQSRSNSQFSMSISESKNYLENVGGVESKIPSNESEFMYRYSELTEND